MSQNIAKSCCTDLAAAAYFALLILVVVEKLAGLWDRPLSHGPKPIGRYSLGQEPETLVRGIPVDDQGIKVGQNAHPDEIGMGEDVVTHGRSIYGIYTVKYRDAICCIAEARKAVQRH